jgi:Sucrose synthase
MLHSASSTFNDLWMQFRYISKGKRLMKNQALMDELEKSMDDKVEKDKLMEGFLGYIICSTQVIRTITLLPSGSDFNCI